MYAAVPLVTASETDPDNPPSRTSRAEVFDWIVAEINAALPDLETTHGSGGHGRITKGAANTLLATLYLNAEVYTGTAEWAKCKSACDAVINSGVYDLMPTVMDVFALANEGLLNTEYILTIAHLPLDGVSSFRHMATLHYNNIPASPWTGFSVLTDFYNSYDSSDARLEQILVGQSYVLFGSAAGDSAFDRQGNPLSFTVDFPLVDANESAGPRILKWPIDPNMTGWFSGADFAIFRYSHVLLMKAEADFNLSGGGLADLNQVHTRAGLDALASIDSDAILAERGHELLWEGYRRQDLIRHGKFLEAWTHKDASDGGHRVLFPIPQSQLDANPNLVQNPGY